MILKYELDQYFTMLYHSINFEWNFPLKTIDQEPKMLPTTLISDAFGRRHDPYVSAMLRRRHKNVTGFISYRNENPCADPEGGVDRGSGPPHPLKNHKNKGFLGNTGPDHLKKLLGQHSMLGHHWHASEAKRHGPADDGPLTAIFRSSKKK